MPFCNRPSGRPAASGSFPLGTDAIGRDILSRLIFGSRYSLFIGCIVVSVSLVIGVFLGLCAGYFRGRVDTVIMRVMDIVLAFPSLLLALVLVAVLGPSLINAMIAIAIVQQPHYVRLTRAAVHGRDDQGLCHRGAGRRRQRMLRLMFITVLPNCMGPLIVQAALSFSSAILDAAALGFLGMGAQPPTPEWGTMLAEAREFILRAWWVVTFPGACHSLHGPGHQPDGRWPAGRPRSETQTILTAAMPLLEIENLTVTFQTAGGLFTAVDRVSLLVGPGRDRLHRRRIGFGQIGGHAGPDGSAALDRDRHRRCHAL